MNSVSAGYLFSSGAGAALGSGAAADRAPASSKNQRDSKSFCWLRRTSLGRADTHGCFSLHSSRRFLGETHARPASCLQPTPQPRRMREPKDSRKENLSARIHWLSLGRPWRPTDLRALAGASLAWRKTVSCLLPHGSRRQACVRTAEIRYWYLRKTKGRRRLLSYLCLGSAMPEWTKERANV